MQSCKSASATFYQIGTPFVGGFAARIRFKHKPNIQNCFMINVLPELEVLTSQKLQFCAAAKCTKLIMSCLKWC